MCEGGVRASVVEWDCQDAEGDPGLRVGQLGEHDPSVSSGLIH